MRDIFHEELEGITAQQLKMTALVKDAIEQDEQERVRSHPDQVHNSARTRRAEGVPLHEEVLRC